MKKAMKQSRLIFLVNLVTAALLLVILASLGLTMMQSIKADKLNENRFELTECANKFMSASAYLTSEVRAYSATADKVHYNNYLTEKDTTKTRETSLSAIKELGVTADEIAIMEELMAVSDKLVPIELESMSLVDAGDLKAAVKAVLGVTYNAEITKMQELKTQFLSELSARTTAEVNKGVSATRIFEVQTLILVVAILLLRIYSYNIVKKRVIMPIIAVEKEMRLIADGNLSSDFSLTPDTSEMGMLIDSILTTKGQLKTYIIDISERLRRMANQDFSLVVDTQYNGDFMPIKDSLNEIILSLNRYIKQIDRSADAVADGSVQVSGNAQDGAVGTARQAVALEEISGTFDVISAQIQETAEKAGMATELANAAGIQLGKSNEQLQGMLGAMNEISDASGEIGKIIRTIEDIAFQTNILALNAAVEAARAGAAGKGFAVVADEVRNLANKSAEASKSTSQMIENSLFTIQSGAKIATEASNTFVNVMVNAGRAAQAMGDISITTKEQSKSIAQIAAGISDISSVVQKNSVSLEQSAGISEELMQQASGLRDLVHEFRLLN